MKKWFFFLVALILLPSALAINLNVEKTSENEVLIVDIEQPVVFNLKITNLGAPGNFEFYNLASFSLSPETFSLTSGETREIQLALSPIGKISQRGYYTVPVYIRASDTSEIKQDLTFKVINLKDAFEVGSGDVDPQTQEIEIYIKNLESVDFGTVNVLFSSAFFSLEKTLPLQSREVQRFSVQLSREDFKNLMAGFYTLNAEVTAFEKKADVEGVIRFVEKDILTTTKKDYGFLINTQIITKINEGNTLAASDTVIKKNLVSRLFTTFLLHQTLSSALDSLFIIPGQEKYHQENL